MIVKYIERECEVTVEETEIRRGLQTTFSGDFMIANSGFSILLSFVYCINVVFTLFETITSHYIITAIDYIRNRKAESSHVITGVSAYEKITYFPRL